MSLHLLNEYWLEFDGVDDFLQAENNTDLDFAMPIKVDLEFDDFDAQWIMGKQVWGPAGNRNQLFINAGGELAYFTTNSANSQNIRLLEPISGYSTGQKYEIEIRDDGSDRIMLIDGVEVDRITPPFDPQPTTDTPFRVGIYPDGSTSSVSGRIFHGKIYSFQIGTEIFPLNEGTGTTITGSEGTILDIYGATWGGQPSKEIKDVYIEDSGILKPVKYIFLGTSTGFSTVYQGEHDPGQVEYTTPGTYYWTVPDEVTKVSVVCVGAGASAGGGGGLGWIKDYAVTPGDSIEVVVGAPGPYNSGTTSGEGVNGGDSYFASPSVCMGGGGIAASNGSHTSTYVGDGGGVGGRGIRSGGNVAGGGAGGYSGAGGDAPGGSGAGGGGSAGVNSSSVSRKGGGGVGIYGEGPSGVGGSNPGKGGSGGEDALGDPEIYRGGNFGGGGPARGWSAAGGSGAVRIIWGNSKVIREYPSTNTEDY